ncbi:MAG: alpha/beta fold hydrolase [Blastocatellia bacterium]
MPIPIWLRRWKSQLSAIVSGNWPGNNAYNEFSNPFLNRDDLKAADHLTEIHVPALILIGDRDVPEIKRIAEALSPGIKGSRQEVIKDSGHITNMEQPAQFDRFTLSFLGGIYARPPRKEIERKIGFGLNG